jgi:hypothetical protein
MRYFATGIAMLCGIGITCSFIYYLILPLFKTQRFETPFRFESRGLGWLSALKHRQFNFLCDYKSHLAKQNKAVSRDSHGRFCKSSGLGF